MTTRITLGANSIDAKPVTVEVPDDRALAYVESLHMLDAQRRERGTTPLTVTNVEVLE